MIDARISDTQLGRDVRQLIADGALTQMSIGFLPTDDGQTITRTETGIAVTVTRATLYEVSVVPFPAYEDTAITDQRSAAIEREKMALRRVPPHPGHPARQLTLTQKEAQS